MQLRVISRRAGFTLVELLAVLIIIGVLMAFILTVAVDGVRRAEERATQSLIVKLDSGVSDRLEAILTLTVDINFAHRFLGTIYNSLAVSPGNPFGAIPSEERAGVIGQMDVLKAELPDVFFIQVDPNALGGNTGLMGVYPLNFGALPYAPGSVPPSCPYPTLAPYVLPLGHAIARPEGDTLPAATVMDPGTGIYGASYWAAAGLYKNLGYAPAGYDGRDNNGDLIIDDLLEGTNNGDTTLYVFPEFDDQKGRTYIERIQTHLRNHDPRTARSEMLYALLVEGSGPIGSVMRRDDFTDREVQDTDHDGMPEFVDAWGQPIQFFRWPIHYTSSTDYQKGWTLYLSATESRQQDPLDPNQLLVTPAWWYYQANQTPDAGNFPQPNVSAISGTAYFVSKYFHSLVDMNATVKPNSMTFQYWDRGAGSANDPFYERRAYYSRFLIASGGLDHNLGIGMCTTDYAQLDVNWGGSQPSTKVLLTSPWTNPLSALWLNAIEGAAAPLTPFRNDQVYWSSNPQDPITFFLQDAGSDDITNHNVLTAGGGVR